MTHADWLEAIERMTDVEYDTLLESTELATLPGWDSLTQVRFALVAKRAAGVTLAVDRIAGCRRVRDLLDLVRVDPS